MRHIGTVIAAIVVGPLAWLLLAVGQDRSAQQFANAQDGGAVGANGVLRPVLLLAAAGVLLGLLAALRFSPLGAVLTGTFYVASGLGPLASPRLLNLFDHTLTLRGHHADLAVPVRTGTALVLGSLLLVGVASVHRWRSWPRPAADAPAAVSPDELIPAPAGADRPLGADGLDLPRPGRAAEPEPEWIGGPRWATPAPARPPGPERAGGREWVGDPERAGGPERVDGPEWASLPRRGSGDALRQADPTRNGPS